VPNRSRSVMLILLLLAGGCDTNRSNPPVSPVAPTRPTPVPTVRVEGVVVDGDRDGPIGGAFVKVVAMGWCGGDREVSKPEWSALTDGNGVFGFTTDPPPDCSYFSLEAVRSGYELSRTRVDFGAAASVALKVQPRLTIHPGEALETQIIWNAVVNCFVPCRRAFVESPPGDLVDIEVTARDSQAIVGLQAGPIAYPLSSIPNRRITVSSGEFVIIDFDGDRPVVPVTLTATRH
jgi:hypothetical protein